MGSIIKIESRQLWKPKHLKTIFEISPVLGKGITKQLFKKGFCLPSVSNFYSDDLERVAEAMLKYLK